MSFFRSLFSFSRKEINEAFKEARLHATYPGITILISPLSTSTHGKLLITIPKAFGSAPERNKLRRQLKAIYYEQQLYQKPHIGIILIKKNRKKYSFEELLALMKKQFSHE